LQGGRLEEVVDQHDHQPRRHDQGGWSQARYQRHVDKLAEDHLRAVADELDRLVRRLRGPRVVLMGAEDIRSEFVELVAPETRNAIVGWAHAKAHATPAELLDQAQPVLEHWRAEREREAIERWREEAGKDGRAAAGWAATLEAASDGRVELLLFQQGARQPAFQCPACGRVAFESGKCPLDGTSLEEDGNGLDLAVHQTLMHGGTVWAVRHHQDLEPVEGIGALLRY
jgi:peptide chain release factor subunit 1